MLLLDVGCGIALVAIGTAFSFSMALGIGLVAIPVLSLTSSWLAFSTFTWWFNFIPMTAGIFAHTLWEHTSIYLRLRALHPAEVAELEDDTEPPAPAPRPKDAENVIRADET